MIAFCEYNWLDLCVTSQSDELSLGLEDSDITHNCLEVCQSAHESNN